MRARGFEVQLLHLLADDEQNPALDGNIRLVDWEAGQDRIEKKMTIDARALRRYQDNLQRFCGEVENFCHRHGIAYLRMTSAMPFDELLFRRLRERRFLA